MIARAWVLVMLLAGIASAEPARVPMVLVDAPKGFDTARLSTSLETYVTNAVIVVAPRAAAADDVVCADALAMARLASTPIALWARWTSPLSIALSMASVDKGCAAIETSTVDVPPEQPDFVYRVAALKIASLVRVLPEASAPAVELVPPTATTPEAWSEKPTIVRVPYWAAIDLGVTGVASTASSARTYALAGSFWLQEPGGWPRFSIGATLVASAAHEAEAAGGSGSARLFAALVGARARIAQSGRVAIIAELDAGIATVWSSAERSNGTPAMSERVWTPIATFAPHVRLGLTRRFHLALGPTLDVSRAISLTLGDTLLYRASSVRFRWDIRAERWF